MSAAPLAEAALEDDGFVGVRDHGWHLFHVLSLTGAVLGEDLVHLGGGQVVVELVVDLDGGRPAAGADALDFLKREETVTGDLFVADAEGGLAVVEDLVAAAQHAGDVGADLHVVFAGGLGAEHGVVGEHVADIELEDVDAGGNLVDDGFGDVADLILRVEQHGDEGGAPEGIDGDEVVEACGELGREDRVGDGAHLKFDFMSGKATRNREGLTGEASSEFRPRILSGRHHLAGEALGGEVHLFTGAVETDGAIFFEVEGLGGVIACGKLCGGEAEQRVSTRRMISEGLTSTTAWWVELRPWAPV